MSGTDIRTASLVDELVGLVAADADAVALAQSLDDEIQAVASYAEQCAFFSRISDLTSEQCDKVGRWFKLVELEGWAFASVAQKRAVLLEMVNVYRRRGTRWAWERIVAILETETLWDGGLTEWDGGATIWDDRTGMYQLTEWWEQAPTDPPHTYRVDAAIEHYGLSVAEIRHLMQVLEAYIPAREQLLELSETLGRSAEIACCSYSDCGLWIEVGP